MFLLKEIIAYNICYIIDTLKTFHDFVNKKTPIAYNINIIDILIYIYLTSFASKYVDDADCCYHIIFIIIKSAINRILLI